MCFSSPGPRPSYLLLTPRFLRPEVPPSVSVSILTTSPVVVSAHVVHGNQTVASESVTIPDSESSYWHPYSLEVKGHVGGIQVFSNSTELHFHPKGFSTFIQTDKLNYLPGQVVKIRAVSIQPDGRPYTSPDPRGNVLRQWLSVDSVLGVVSKEFQLSENPPLGEWTIVTGVNVRALGFYKDCRTYLSTTKVSLAKHKYKLSFDGYPQILRPSLNFTARVRKTTFFISVSQCIFSVFIYLRSSGGLIVMHFLHFLCKFTSSKCSKSIDFTHCSIFVNKAYFFMCFLCVKVKSRGQVVSAGKSSGALTLVPEISWAPLACVIVYCVHPDGEIVNDVLQLPITQTLRNKVSLSWSNTMSRPAEEVTLRVAVEEPGSLVGILVVDKATQWTGSRNDITKERVRTTADSLLRHSFIDLVDSDSDKGKDVSVQYFGLRPNTFQTDHIPINLYAAPFGFKLLFYITNHVSCLYRSNSDTAEITLTVPDTITTWTATAFVMSENLGLGIVERPAQLTVFQDFFLSLNLPAYIIRGEELLLEIILFNYLPQDLEVMVIVAESGAFEFVFPDNEELSMPSVRRVSVGRESGTSVLVPIRPLVLGEIPVSVKAVSSAASDSVRTTVLVKAEGLEQSFSTSLLFELSASQSSLSRRVTFTFPADVVEGSERASVTAVGDILGPSISGLDSLIQMPHGCGEQNMINFAPNVYVLQYLSATGQTSQDATDRAEDFMMKGYERQLSYQRVDGSFSAFGDQDSSGSTWLTAFVLRCFLQARPFISIDANVLHKAAAWLGFQQGADGRFEEPGRVIHTELQGGQDGPVSLTAYVLIYGSQVSAALLFLETRLALGVSSNYSLSLLVYALALSGSSSADTALSELIGRAEMRDGVPTWSSPDVGLSSSWQPRSADVEMASYLLLAQYKLGHVADGLGLMKWLSQQRNHRGGFGSTQDTVVALQALSTFAALGGSHDFDLTVRVNTDASTAPASFHIHGGNHLLQQTAQCLILHLSISLSLTPPLLPPQLNVFYNIRNEELTRRRREAGGHEAFHLYVELFDTEIDSAHLYICSRGDLGLNATGMAILEVGVLSGFSLPPDGVQTDRVVRKVETRPGSVILYLDSVTTDDLCLVIPLVMEHKVAKVQEATVLIYDYYEPSKSTVHRSSFLHYCHSLSFDSCDYISSVAPSSPAVDGLLALTGDLMNRHYIFSFRSSRSSVKSKFGELGGMKVTSDL
uniref:CD109 molecule n=1 Tax=Seriola dumerili TaxID=41447 RepID=A0A3B4UE28_SERDU